MFYPARVYPRRATIIHGQSKVVTGASMVMFSSSNGNQIFGVYWQQSPAFNGDAFSSAIFLGAGSYKITLMGSKQSNCGLLTISLDGVAMLTNVDFYSATSVFNVDLSGATITVGTSGMHLLSGVVTGKNASSTGYGIFLTYIEFLPLTETTLLG